jgi:hypothetical protein
VTRRGQAPRSVGAKAEPARKRGSGEPVVSPVFIGVALVIGLYAMAPGFYLAGLHVKPGAEVVDHVVPGLVVIAMVGVAMLWGVRSYTVMAVSGLIVVLAGFWMVLTHIGLFRQGVNGDVAFGAAAYHCSTAILVFALGVTWVWRYRAGLSDD